MRLAATAKQYYRDLDGYAVSRNMPRVRDMPMDRFCNFVWFFFTRNADEKEKEKFEQRLWLPPKGEVGRGIWSAEAEQDALASLKRQLGN